MVLLIRRNASAPDDAIGLLMMHHREIERWFEAFQLTISARRRIEIAHEIREAVGIHLEISQRVFYPAVARASKDRAQLREVLAEHQAIRRLLDEIDRVNPAQDRFFAKIHQLCDLFLRHLRAEEGEHGLFAQTKRASMDLDGLGESLRRRKDALTALYSLSHG